jgi:hypothetical protein
MTQSLEHYPTRIRHCPREQTGAIVVVTDGEEEPVDSRSSRTCVSGCSTRNIPYVTAASLLFSFTFAAARWSTSSTGAVHAKPWPSEQAAGPPNACGKNPGITPPANKTVVDLRALTEDLIAQEEGVGLGTSARVPLRDA